MAEDRPASQIFAQVTTEMTSSGLGIRFQARGRSMFPTIQDGEILHVCPVDPDSIKFGDIVLFRDRDGFKAHRVIHNKQGVLITRGDSSAQADNQIRSEHVVGRVIAKESAASGELVRLDGIRAKLGFLTREARRQISSHLHRV